ncbi:MAG: hypothetical protein SOW80_08675 [Anaerovoracaceae bacterium]|nr:hypothetical protein [Anaerovoracaceae bacterium]
MKNKRIFSLSKALITENLKMYWYLPALSFIAYFMAGIFPLIMDSSLRTDPNRTYLEDSLNNMNVFFCLLLVAVPLIAAVTMMGYFHKPAQAMTIHAQPFSRNRIYCSQTLTGWLLCVLPVAAMTLLYLFIAGMPAASLYWGCNSVAILTFFYGLFVLSGSLVGSSVMQVLLSGVLFGIVPLILWLVYCYCESFLNGFYTMPEGMEDFMSRSNPLLYLVTEIWNGKAMPVPLTLAYLAVGLILLILAGLAYERARLERVGDSMMYRLFEEIITWLIVFVGMTVFGYFFYNTLCSRSMLLVGMAVGLLLSFIIVKIILARSIRILTKQNLLSLGILTVLAALFTGVVMFDLAGYGRWVPDAEDVASVDSDSIYYNDGYNYYQFADGFSRENETLTSQDAIEKVVALHQYAAEHSLGDREYTELAQESGNNPKKYVHLTFRYEMKDGSRCDRQYRVEMTEKMIGLLNEVLSCEEYRADACLSEQITAESVSYIYISAYDNRWEKYGYNAEAAEEAVPEMTGTANTAEAKDAADQEAILTINNPQEIEDFLAALRKDDYNRTYTAELAEDTKDQITEDDSLSVYCSIVIKEGADGTASPETDGSSSLVQTDYVYPKDANTATVDFNLNGQDRESLRLLREMLYAEGYQNHAKLLEKY